MGQCGEASTRLPSITPHPLLAVPLVRRRDGPLEAFVEYFSDTQRHLICWPYSIENLHQMATALQINRCWFHPGRHAHYDLPKRRIAEIAVKTHVVSTREILDIIKGKEPWELQKQSPTNPQEGL